LSTLIFEDSEVIDLEAMEENVKAIIKEISQDSGFELVEFLSSQDKPQLLTFVLKYLEESEDIRLVIMAYLWYKSQNPKPPFLS
jgi:DNA polymerase III delta subunit